MSLKKKARIEKVMCDWVHLFVITNLDEYINDVDRGILKFVNKGFYSQYKSFKISLNDLVPYPRAIMTPFWGKLITWYEKMYNCKLKDYNNIEKVIKADYDNIYNLYFCSPGFSGIFCANTDHLRFMIDNNATKCINLLFRLNAIRNYDATSCFYYITKIGNRKMFIFFMNKINNDLEKYVHIDILMNICISHHNENILELLIDTYGYEPSRAIIRRINGPHFNCGLCQAIVLKL